MAQTQYTIWHNELSVQMFSVFASALKYGVLCYDFEHGSDNETSRRMSMAL